MITQKPIPQSSTSSWTRSNPPKFRRLLHQHNDANERSETRYVYITGLVDPTVTDSNRDENEGNEQDEEFFWKQPHAVLEVIRQKFNEYDSSGDGIEIFLNKKQNQLIRSLHIGMRSASDAQKIVKALQGQTVVWEFKGHRLQSETLFLDYVSVTQRSMKKSKARANGVEPEKGEASRPECTSATESIEVPGLQVIENYLTQAQEAVLMAILTGPQAPWAPNQQNMSQTGDVKRKVQHYGYVFDYKTADVLRDRSQPGHSDCPPMPAMNELTEKKATEDGLEADAKAGKGWEVLAGVAEKTRQYQFDAKECVSYPNLNQLTINHYKPGEGIGSHVDTPSAFGDGLISISLNGGIVMEFRKVDSPLTKKLVYLPPRSLVLMSGPARYEWEHMIVTRRTDCHNGQVLPRKLRVSLTLRTALTVEGAPLPLIESNKFPPVWGSPSGGVQSYANDATTAALATPTTERDHVHAVYDAIATQWHHTRGKRGVLWPGATQFLQRLPKGSVVADVGCGDGKYFPAVWEAGSYVIGTDISRPLLETAFGVAGEHTKPNTNEPNTNIPESRRVSVHREGLRDRPAVAVADCMHVPLRTSSVDAAICIAVMHHLSTPERRVRCIEELVRIVQPGGTINIQAWAMEQEQNSRRRFAAPDVFVPFNAQPKYLEKVDWNNSKNQSSDHQQATAESNPSDEKATSVEEQKSVAELYSEQYTKADYDERKGLVIFQRYCHMYRKGELEKIVEGVEGATLVESGYETGNHFVIIEVTK
ncbi:MAG: hypothetical protein SGBAC_001557 [Bacillariaceae sp.]